MGLQAAIRQPIWLLKDCCISDRGAAGRGGSGGGAAYTAIVTSSGWFLVLIVDV